MKIIKTKKFASMEAPLPKLPFTPQEKTQYMQVDAQFQSLAEQIKELNHQLYRASTMPQDQVWKIEDKISNLEQQKNALADKLYRICQRARTRGSDSTQKPPKESSKGQQWLSKIVRQFGYTTNPHEAGYIHPNGNLIDFSGRRFGNAQPGARAMDHREVASYIPELGRIADDPSRYAGQSDAMRTFMMHSGAIRLMFGGDNVGIHMAAIPTTQQINKILSLAKGMREVSIDVSTADENTDKWGKVLNDPITQKPVQSGAVRKAIEEGIKHLQTQQN